MSELIATNHNPLPLPTPKVNLNIRLATMQDIAFIDSLQKKYNKNLGFMATKTLEGKVQLQSVLIAEEMQPLRHGGTEEGDHLEISSQHLLISQCLGASVVSRPVGYLIGQDRYFKRDDVGIVYQICVDPNVQRGYVGAALLKAMFERSAYGCKLYCCWCAQDIAANRFWESMGFTPIAFRTGSATKGKGGSARQHIFWQKRIRQGDTTTPFWYPSKTEGGSLVAERLVFPIPPGAHWNDAKPVVLPEMQTINLELPAPSEQVERKPRAKKKVEPVPVAPVKSGPCQMSMSKLSFGAPMVKEEIKIAPIEESKVEKPPKPRKAKIKFDPKLVSAARELRDRYLEQYNNSAQHVQIGKYDVGRLVDETVRIDQPPMHLLEAA